MRAACATLISPYRKARFLKVLRLQRLGSGRNYRFLLFSGLLRLARGAFAGIDEVIA